jgi:hypothetical protein
MNIKKVLAIGASAAVLLGAGATFGSAAISDYVVTDDGSLSSPKIVIGDPAPAKDVLGAADIAAHTAGHATTDTVVAGTTTFSVNDGVGVDTSNTKIYLGDALTKTGLRNTVTSVNLPTLLASGTLTDDTGTNFKYDQYVTFGGGTITYGTSGGDLSDPELYLDIGSSTATPLYNLTLTFNKLLNLSSTDIQGNALEIFGGKYTVGAGSSFDGTTDKLILFGSSNVQTLSEGDEKTITIEGTDHTVKLWGVSSASVAVVSVDGTSKEITQGNSYSIEGVTVYADSIFYYPKETQVSQAKLSFGSQKITLEDGTTVKTGQSDDTVDGTFVDLVGTAAQGISKLTIVIAAKDSSNDFILGGSTWTDPLFDNVKVAFGGLTGGVTDAITVDNSGTTASSLTFTDYRGNEKTITWAYTPSTSFAPALNASSTREYRVMEGETMKKNDYILVSPSITSEFGHLMQYTSASSIGSTGAYIELKDIMSGDTNRIFLTESGNAEGNFFLDGNQYYVDNVSSANQWFNVTWGTGSGIGNVGDATTLYPLIQTRKGAWVTLTKPVTLTNTLVYEIPTNATFNFSLNVNNGTSPVYGRVTWNISADGTNFNMANMSASFPGILIIEEKGKDTSDVEVKDAVQLTIGDGSGTGVDVTIQSPVITSTTTNSGTLQSDNSVTVYYDRYGTAVKYDSDSQGLIEITYPDEQALAMVGIGTAPVFSTAAGGTTVKTATLITSPVAKLASEIDTTALVSDLIIIGGPCANTLAATLMADDNVTCDTWAFTTGVIKEYTDAFGSGQKALVVAGTSADDTRSLAAKVIQGTMSFEE